jgi:hypothetical protein
MRAIMSAVLGLGLVFAVTVGSQAADDKDKEKKLEGTICCAKCELKKTDKCATVIVVKDGDKETVYFFDKDSDKKYHKKICTEALKGSVTGSVKKDGDKMIVTVKELKWDK